MDFLNGTHYEGISLCILEFVDINSLKSLRLSNSTIKKFIEENLVKFKIQDLETAINYANKGFKVKYVANENITQEDVNRLGNVYELDLSDCGGITDVSALGNVHTLNLSYNDNLTDVSALGNVHTLNLSGCIGITDVSMLGNVKILNISWCYGITDISMLKNVKIIDR